MTTRLSLLALAFLLPLAACETETEPVATDPVVVDPATPAQPPPTADPASDVTAQGTLDAVQQAGGLTQLAIPAAVNNIDSWIARLEGTPGAENVTANLRTLRDQIQANPIDGNAVGMTLTDLGNETTSLAAGDTALEQLGAALTEAGQQLTGGSM